MGLFRKPTNEENAMVVSEKLTELEAGLERLQQRVDTLERQLEHELQRQRGLALIVNPRTMSLELNEREQAREQALLKSAQDVREQRTEERAVEAARREQADAAYWADVIMPAGF
jgi:hypothetical protein